MKKFMAVYTGAPDGFDKWSKLDETTRKAREQQGMQAWGDWMQKHQAVILETGGPLGKTKRVTSAGVADVRNNLAGYVAIKAESHEAAAKLFLNHPHFAIFPGDGVEIMEVLPIPGQ
jgi:hemolysin-activating ACP:hemolysin acyltransferase